jgi:serine protease inhibitor ecotin
VASGQISIAREVLVQSDDALDEIVAVGDAPAGIGEQLILRLVGSDRETELRVTVVEARPLVVDGNVRHWMRLSVDSATARTE